MDDEGNSSQATMISRKLSRWNFLVGMGRGYVFQVAPMQAVACEISGRLIKPLGPVGRREVVPKMAELNG